MLLPPHTYVRLLATNTTTMRRASGLLKRAQYAQGQTLHTAKMASEIACCLYKHHGNTIAGTSLAFALMCAQMRAAHRQLLHANAYVIRAYRSSMHRGSQRHQQHMGDTAHTNAASHDAQTQALRAAGYLPRDPCRWQIRNRLALHSPTSTPLPDSPRLNPRAPQLARQPWGPTTIPLPTQSQ